MIEIDRAVVLRACRRGVWAGALVATLAYAGTAPAQNPKGAVRKGPAPNVAGQRFTTPIEALIVGQKLLEAGQFEKARGPLEQGRRMATDDQMQVDANRLLLAVYFHAGETEKVITALDVVLTKADQEPLRKQVRQALIEYARGTGRSDAIRTRYEARLKKDPEDVPALYVLIDIYTELQKNLKRAGELVEQLARAMKKSGGDLDRFGGAYLAEQYTKVGKYKEGAALYEKNAEAHPEQSLLYYNRAADAWIKGGDRVKALAAAKASDAAPPETRNRQLTHLMDMTLGDMLVQLNEPALAVKHLEKAVANTDNPQFLEMSRRSLSQARAMVARGGGGTAPATSTIAAPSRPASGIGSGPVDLNRASVAQLRSVDGISEDLAVQIVARRKAVPFSSVSELIELEGVDKALLARVRPRLTANPK